MKATQQLKDEHEGIMLMLSIIRRVCRRIEPTGTMNQDHINSILEFLKVFVDRCHHGKEEDLLFPALESAGVPKDGGPIGVMLHEHTMGRSHVQAMREAFADYLSGNTAASQRFIHAGYDYIALLEAHIEKENTVLFELADQLLAEVKQEELFQGFEKIEQERIGAGRHEEFHAVLAMLSSLYR